MGIDGKRNEVVARGVNIEFPRLGVVRRLPNRTEGYRQGYPTPWAYNVRLEDALTKRLRGGSFTGQTSDTFVTDHTWDGFTATAHVLTDGTPVQLTTTGTLPSGLSLATTYYVISATPNTFKLSTRKDGDAVALADDGSGTHTINPVIAKPSPVYRDRAITFSDNAITAARQGDSTDTDLDADVSDVARPILFQLSVADAVGGNVVAVVPHKDAHLLAFTATETWVLSGDPATGSLRRVSDKVGILGANAYCVAHDTVYFMSKRGLYQVGADGSGLKAVSEDRIPEHLIGLTDTACILTYTHENRGVNCHMTTAPSWFYDIEREGFWPFDTDETDSHLLIGPLRIGSLDTFGLIQTLHGITATGSASVTWAIVPGETAEEAAANGKAAITADLADSSYATYIQGSGTFSAGRSITFRPRVTAMWACIWLRSTGTWAYEGITMNTIPAGVWR